MYCEWDPRNPSVREKVYGEAAEYGIVCRIQDLKTVVEGIDRYLKKTKVRGQGLCKRFGQVNGISESPEKQWTEWVMDAGAIKNNVLTAEQGLFWYFDLQPNRHFRIGPDGTAREVYIFPDRKDLAYIIFLDKKIWTVEREGEFVCTDSPKIREEREHFFAGLLNSAGFPLELLYTYEKEERERIYTLSGSLEEQKREYRRSL